MSDKREVIAKNVAIMLKDGDFVNLGVGIPTLVSNYIPEGMTIILQAENGAAGLSGNLPAARIFDDGDTFLQWESTHKGEMTDHRTGHKDLLDAGSNPSYLMDGACTFDMCTSFAMLRGGHLDATVLGAMQVDQEGSLANWMVPGKMVSGMGGAMDILAGTKKVIIATTLTAGDGSPKLLKKCTLPLTAVNCVSCVVTEKCIVEIENGKFVVTALYPGVTKEEVEEAIEGEVVFKEELAEMLA